MMLVYAMARGVAMVLRMFAEFRHRRAKAKYERLEEAFRKSEDECKAHEVSVGRPVDYSQQLALLKRYELREASRALWMRTARTLNRRKRQEARVRSIWGVRLPYAFGVIDTTLVLWLVGHFEFNQGSNALEALARSLF